MYLMNFVIADAFIMKTWLFKYTENSTTKKKKKKKRKFSDKKKSDIFSYFCSKA